MPLDISIQTILPDGTANLGRFIGRELEEAKARLTSNLAEEVTVVLRLKGKNIWPRETGFSAGRFLAEEDHRGNILVANTAPYARAVNNRKHYPRGGANPNYRAAQRQIEAQADRILQKALRDI
ncbi:MAG: hypothetical protein OXQ29_18065 [Rhodospirillaceae bacterium]|nr:hypothetical protein [Rhodospirillaceae bacterium]